MTIEDKQMTITADEIRKAALELIGDAAQCEYEYSGADALSAKVTIGYIVGAKDFTEKIIEMIEEGENIIKYLLDLSREYTEVCCMYKYVAEEALEYENLTHDITPDAMDDTMKGELKQLADVWRLRLYGEEGDAE